MTCGLMKNRFWSANVTVKSTQVSSQVNIFLLITQIDAVRYIQYRGMWFLEMGHYCVLKSSSECGNVEINSQSKCVHIMCVTFCF